MEHNHDLEWAELISLYKLVRYDDGPETFESLLEMIRTACDGAFDVVFAPHIKAPGPHIMQHKWLPWDELFDIMKLSGKNFIIDLPQEVNWVGYRFRRDTDGEIRVYARYDDTTDTILLRHFTGREEEEENTAPAYDGYGRYDTYYECLTTRIVRRGQPTRIETQWR